MDRVIDLQRGRQVGHRMDRVTRNVDVVIEQQVARAEYHVREIIGDQTDVAGAHAPLTGAGQEAEHRAGAAIDRQILCGVIADRAGDGAGVVNTRIAARDSAASLIVQRSDDSAVVNTREPARDSATRLIVQRGEESGAANTIGVTGDNAAVVQCPDGVGIVNARRASTVNSAAVAQRPYGAAVADTRIAANDSAASPIAQRSDGTAVVNATAAARDSAAVAQRPDSGGVDNPGNAAIDSGPLR